MGQLNTVQIVNGLDGVAEWVRFRTVAYMRGRGVLFGVEAEYFPRQAIQPGVYPLYMDVLPHPALSVCDGSFSLYAKGSLDYFMLGSRFTHLASNNAKEFVRECADKVKVGGHFIVALPMNVGINPSTPSSIRQLMHDAASWVLKETVEKGGFFVQIYKKLAGGRGVVERKPSSKPRACIVRYGAMGDLIMVTPLIRKLAEDGYEVTLNLTPYSADVVRHNPYVHNLLIQERDAIPNPTLGRYWKEWEKEYDRYINLSESIEGTLLKVEGRRDYFTHQAWRHEKCNKNYYDFTMERGGYPDVKGVRGELYFSHAEEKEARRVREKYKDKFLVLWALNGSSFHKRYGHLKTVLTSWLERRPEAVVILVGDERAKELQVEHPQVVCGAGQWSIRHSMALAKVADLVVGPESVMTNAAGCFSTPKITMLSHSTHENLCKYWENDYCLAPDPSAAPCYPCHQLHYSLESCPLVKEEGGERMWPVCALNGISPDRMIARIEEVYSNGPVRQVEQSPT